MTKKSELLLDKPPMNVEIERPKERLSKLERFLTEELAAHGNSLYAQDLKSTINHLNERNW